MSAFVIVGVTEGIVDGDDGSVITLGDRNLNRASGMESFVHVSAIVVEDALEQAAFKDITCTDQEPFSPAVFDAKHILVLCEGVGDEVTCEGKALLFGEVPVISSSDTQLGRKLKLVGALDHSPLE